MIHKVIISWDDEDLDEAPTWEDFMREYILDEMHGFIDDMDLSMKTINHAHNILDKIMCHLNRYVEPVRHGKWIRENNYGIWKCSECGCKVNRINPLKGNTWNYYYCPNCGSRLMGDE